MDMICKGISSDECFKRAVEEYEAQLMDKQAESQAKKQPLHQALLVFKRLIMGYRRLNQTMQHDKEACRKWDTIKLNTMKHYLVWDIRDIPPEKLAEANLYAINLMKELL